MGELTPNYGWKPSRIAAIHYEMLSVQMLESVIFDRSQTFFAIQREIPTV